HRPTRRGLGALRPDADAEDVYRPLVANLGDGRHAGELARLAAVRCDLNEAPYFLDEQPDLARQFLNGSSELVVVHVGALPGSGFLSRWGRRPRGARAFLRHDGVEMRQRGPRLRTPARSCGLTRP